KIAARGAPKEWFAVARTARPAPPDALIFEVAEGALSSPNASLLMGGNPTRSTGYFAASHKHNRGDFRCLHFKSQDSPLVAPGYRAGLVRKFGEGSNVVRVRADGEFP